MTTAGALTEARPLVLLTGIPASGRSTVADLLARRFRRGVHGLWVDTSDQGPEQTVDAIVARGLAEGTVA